MSSDGESDYVLSSRYGKSCSITRKCKEIVPDRFDGTSPWNDYWSHFQACWDINEWSDHEAALVLAASLSKSACKVLNPKLKDYYGNERHFTIHELKNKLERRYGPGQLAESFLIKLQNKRQGPEETIQELGEFVNELVRQAYPDVPDEFVERMGVIHFRDSINEPEIRAALYRSRPSALDDAIKIAVEAQCFTEIEAQRDELKCLHKMTDGNSVEIQERLNRIERRQNELMSLLTNVVPPQRSESRPICRRVRVRSPQKCFYCQELGHIRKKCPYFQRRYKQCSRSCQVRMARVTTSSSPDRSTVVPELNPQGLSKDQVEDCTMGTFEYCETGNHEQSIKQDEVEIEMPIKDCNENVVPVGANSPFTDSNAPGVFEVQPHDSNHPVCDKPCVEKTDIRMENVSDETELDKGPCNVTVQVQGQMCRNVVNWTTHGTLWNNLTCIGYLCATFDFSVYQGGLLCLVWPVYKVTW